MMTENCNEIKYQGNCKLEFVSTCCFVFFLVGEFGRYSAFAISYPKLSHII